MPTLIQVVAATGQAVYVFIWNSLSQVWNTNTSAFETFNAAHWSVYAITATEQAGTGSYFATIPTGITTAGTYSWAAYIRLGASPASGDTPVNQGQWTLYPSGSGLPPSTGLAALITSLRSICEDDPNDKVIYSEQLGGNDQPAYPVNGVNTTFKLKSVPLSDYAGSPIYTYVTIIGTGAVVRTQTGFTIVDQLNGYINFTVAPNPGTPNPPDGVYVDYGYQWFNDNQLAEFIYQACQLTLAGTSDPTTLIAALVPCMLQYGKGLAMESLATRFAMEYQSSGGDAQANPSTKSQQFRALAKDCFAKAKDLLKFYYEGQGQRGAPGYADINHNWDPISPIR